MPRLQAFPLVLAFIVGLNLVHLAEAKITVIPIIDASAALNHAQVQPGAVLSFLDAQGNTLTTSPQSTGQTFYLYVCPMLGFSELPALWITPSIEFEYGGADNLLLVDDETFIFSQRLNVYYLLGANYSPHPLWSLKAKAFGRMEYVASATGETLETGQYNYRDAGGWIEAAASYRLGVFFSRTKLGAKTYQRLYPNFSIATLIQDYETLIGPWPDFLSRSLHAKDSQIDEVWLRDELTWGRLPVLTNVDVHLRNVGYLEMPVVQSDGQFSQDRRRDQYLDITLELPFQVHPRHQFELDYGYRLRRSNQSVYDADGPVWLNGYYNYTQHHVRLLYNITLPFTWAGFPPQGSVSLGAYHRQYPTRPSRQALPNSLYGTYVFSDPHWEQMIDANIVVKQQLVVKWLSVFFSLHAITQTSNSTAEDHVPYNFQYITFSLGTALSF